jgi:hypothetical protein
LKAWLHKRFDGWMLKEKRRMEQRGETSFFNSTCSKMSVAAMAVQILLAHTPLQRGGHQLRRARHALRVSGNAGLFKPAAFST